MVEAMKRKNNRQTHKISARPGEGDLVYFFGPSRKDEMIKKEFGLSLKRGVRDRIRRGFIKTYKPVMDDESYRIFTTMKEYKDWCAKALPKWLGYGKAS